MPDDRWGHKPGVPLNILPWSPAPPLPNARLVRQLITIKHPPPSTVCPPSSTTRPLRARHRPSPPQVRDVTGTGEVLKRRLREGVGVCILLPCCC